MNHKISNVNIAENTAICQVCGLVKVYLKNKGHGKYRWVCSKNERNKSALQWQHRKLTYIHSSSPYRSALKKACEHCGFVPQHKCQLDVHHMDHDHNNNEPTNLMTLCANCHRLDRVGLLIL